MLCDSCRNLVCAVIFAVPISLVIIGATNYCIGNSYKCMDADCIPLNKTTCYLVSCPSRKFLATNQTFSVYDTIPCKTNCSTDVTAMKDTGVTFITSGCIVFSVFVSMLFCMVFIIDKAKVRQQPAIKIKSMLPSEETCSICIETLSSDACAIELCNHMFHKGCIQRWCQNKRTCPNCNQAI